MKTINEVARAAYEDAVAHGFWRGRVELGQVVNDVLCELGEALEAERKDPRGIYYEQGKTKPEGYAVEMVDAIILLLGGLVHAGFDPAQLLRVKMEYNKYRPFLHKEG